MRRVLLVDVSGIIHAMFHIHSNAPDPDEVSNASVSRVRGLAAGYDHVAICVDTGKSFRSDISPAYKAHRDARPEHFHYQYRRAVEILEKDGYLVLGAKDFEADDAIASAVHWLTNNAPESEITISTSDKDLATLIEDGPGFSVRMWSLAKNEPVGAADIQAKFGVPPSMMREFLALTGDSSDAIQGIRGIGKVHAARLLNEFGSISNIYAALNQTPEAVKPPSIAKALIEDVAVLDMALKLVTLRTDAPIDCSQVLVRREPKALTEYPTYDEEETDVQTINSDTGEVTEEPKQTEPEKPRELRASAFAAAPAQRPAEAVQPTSIAMTISPPSWELALEPTNPSSAYKIAASIFNSRMFPQFPNADAVFAVILMGRTLGVDSLTMMRNVYIVEGRVTLSATFIVGLILRSGLADYFKCVESTDERATYKTHRKGDPDAEPTIMTYTIEDAKRQQLLKPSEPGKKPGNWEKIPKTMLRHRCATELARAAFADVCAGLYDPSEFPNGERHAVEAA